MATTKIEWADEVWNPVWGCLNQCRYCYAKGIARRFGKTQDERSFVPTWKESNFNRKFAKSTKRVFVNSMSDIMYWKPEWMQKVIDRIAETPDIDFIFLTKGGTETYDCFDVSYPTNAILGVTATQRTDFDKIDFGLMCLMGSKWLLNIEPILEPMNSNAEINMAACFDWIIVGAETGNSSQMVVPQKNWFDGIVTEARDRGIPVFIKPSLGWAYPDKVQFFCLTEFLGSGYWDHDQHDDLLVI